MSGVFTGRGKQSILFLWANQEEQSWLVQTGLFFCWTLKAEAFLGGLSAVLKAFHLLSELRVWPAGVISAWEAVLPCCIEQGWKTVLLPEVSADLYPWDFCPTSWEGNWGRRSHCRLVSFGPCPATKKIQDIWGLCSSQLPTSDIHVLHQVHNEAFGLWCVQPFKP